MHSMKKVLAISTILASANASTAPVLENTDFIPDGTRTQLVTFNGLTGSGLPAFYTEDGIDVEQIDGVLNNIWSTCGSGICWIDNDTANWYPSGGDLGFTQITLSDGSDFTNFGVSLGSGGLPNVTNNLSYTLVDDGIAVLSGNYNYLIDGYVGFSGGGFDTIQLSATQSGFGGRNLLAIDTIELSSVPLPAAAWLFGSALLGLGALKRKKAQV